MSHSGTDFSAASSAAGYLYQARLALALCLRYANTDSGVEVGIERLDDVSFEAAGTPLELLQAKHHINHKASLSDYSADLWKTLRIWAEAVGADPSLPQRVRFVLVTTGKASDEQVAALLRSPAAYPPGTSRNPIAVAARLTEIAEASENKALAAAHASFLALTPKMRISLLSAVELLDSYPMLTELDQAIEEALRFIAPRGKASTAREMLEGWWWPRVCSALMKSPSEPISVMELEAKLDDIRDQMKRDALVADFEHAELPNEHDLEYEGRPFVRQLKVIGIGGNRIQYAKRDFYRAFAQRSKWVREHLVVDDEITRFEATLIEEWQPRFEKMRDKHSSEPSESQVLQNAGQELYHWVEGEARFPFRTQPLRFLNVGSYHMLANDLRVGWHRDFPNLCKEEE